MPAPRLAQKEIDGVLVSRGRSIEYVTQAGKITLAFLKDLLLDPSVAAVVAFMRGRDRGVMREKHVKSSSSRRVNRLNYARPLGHLAMMPSHSSETRWFGGQWRWAAESRPDHVPSATA